MKNAADRAVLDTSLDPLDSLADRIDALLPQTQCTKCGFAGCRPYAEAIAAGSAQINQCPPGGTQVIAKLASLLGRAPLPLNPVHGIEQPIRVARIDEALCIGCTLCIESCPVDAILGATKRMHTVLLHACTGCELCVAPCPMDCIAMVAIDPPRAWTEDDAAVARLRFQRREARQMRDKHDNEQRLAAKAASELGEVDARNDFTSNQSDQKNAAVRAAMERARARRAAAATPPAGAN